MRFVANAVRRMIKESPYSIFGIILFAGLFLLLNYYVLNLSTTFTVFWVSNQLWYNIAQILLTVISAVVFGVAAMLLIDIVLTRRASGESLLSIILGSIFSLAATGCAVCGAVLLPLLGISVSLAALPIGGLEIKLLTLGLLLYSLYDLSKHYLGACSTPRRPLVTVAKKKGAYTIDLSALGDHIGLILTVLVIVAIYLAPRFPYKINVIRTYSNTAGSVDTVVAQKSITTGSNDAELLAKVAPVEGIRLGVSIKDLGKRLVEYGVIDYERFKSVYDRAGVPLTDKQKQILLEGTNDEIVISRENSYFWLNLFWALGLANKNRILTEGAMTKYGTDQIGNFASTGGWTLAKGTAMDHYARHELIVLNDKQQRLLEKITSGIYRPCCNNPTSFPDCNHGMAMLGLVELLIANGIPEDRIWEIAKYVNAYWFTDSYLQLARYFESTEGKTFDEIDGRVILSKEYSSVSGWQKVYNWLKQNNKLPQNQLQGGGCGV